MKTLIITAIIISLTLPFEIQAAKTKSEKVDSLFTSYQNKNLFNGIILITRNGEIEYQGNAGFANLETEEKNSVSTVFPIASITKQFTAAGILMLEQENKLNLDDKISLYITSTPECARDVTIRHLLTNTSGIPDYIGLIPSHADSIEHFFSGLRSLSFEAGEKYEYINTGYALCGIIIEKVSGKTYAEFMKQRIFEPLEMNNTAVCEKGKVNNSSQVIGYDQEWNSNNYYAATADCGILSTGEDLLKWDAALYTEKLLSQKNIEKLFTANILPDGSRMDYGLGFEIRNMPNGKVVFHKGALPSGCGAYFERNIDNQRSIIILTNRLVPEMYRFLNSLRRIIDSEA